MTPVARNNVPGFLHLPRQLHLDTLQRRVYAANRTAGNGLLREHVPWLQSVTQFEFDTLRGNGPDLRKTKLQMSRKPVILKIDSGTPQLGKHFGKIALDSIR